MSAPGAEISALLSKREYKKLLTDLRRIIREGKEEAQRVAAQALVESYWSIGQRIAKEKLTTRAGFHNAILSDLSTDLEVDLRFEVIRRQRIRLARIDAPARDTPEGARGRRYVREQLAQARTLIVNTHKADLHGRYAAHIFYALNNRGIEHTFTNGRYLNQELVNKGFAMVV
jgi:hypothetical protein